MYNIKDKMKGTFATLYSRQAKITTQNVLSSTVLLMCASPFTIKTVLPKYGRKIGQYDMGPPPPPPTHLIFL